MFNLSEYPNKPQNLADFLPWAALVAASSTRTEAFSAPQHFRGPDLQSATSGELVGVTARLNNGLIPDSSDALLTGALAAHALRVIQSLQDAPPSAGRRWRLRPGASCPRGRPVAFLSARGKNLGTDD
jgi:hypothetical protein